MHPIFLVEAFLTGYLRYSDQNVAKTSVHGTLETKPGVEIWRRPDFLNRRPRLPIRPPLHQSVYLAPLRSFNELRSKVSQSTQLLPVCPLRFCHAFFG